LEIVIDRKLIGPSVDWDLLFYTVMEVSLLKLLGHGKGIGYPAQQIAFCTLL